MVHFLPYRRGANVFESRRQDRSRVDRVPGTAPTTKSKASDVGKRVGDLSATPGSCRLAFSTSSFWSPNCLFFWKSHAQQVGSGRNTAVDPSEGSDDNTEAGDNQSEASSNLAANQFAPEYEPSQEVSLDYLRLAIKFSIIG